ncbi:TnsD family Tn7-like transposition protein [Hydrogenovibrio kuenenii]|uniref:TnsD family Tn7-like transposition protein n=1 Tax=Hydrogenovibrio kuenenii TaxID=63658 RepID=UPI000463A55B|nr:TnsD family Tn7-like transposition protein [Hydrogenovibrio kuenenii]
MLFPNQLPDETLYSRLIRHQTVLGFNEKEYLKRIFQNPRLSIHPFLTVGLTEIAKISGEDTYDLFRNQTLGSLFIYLMPVSGKKIYHSLLKNEGAMAFRHSCLSNFRETKKVTVNYCPVCSEEDIQSYGVTYWHRSHQIPGIESCPVHNVRLIELDLPERPHIKKGFLPLLSESTLCNEKHGQLSQYCFEFLKSVSEQNQKFNLAELKYKLIGGGYVTKGGRIRRNQLSQDFFDCVQAIDFHSHSLLPKNENDYRYLTNLFIPNIAQHPFKYLLFNFFLSQLSQKTLNFEPSLPSIDYQDSSRKNCIQYLQKGLSLAEVARKTGKSVSYLKRLAGLNNIDVLKEPIVLTQRIKARARKMAWRGFHRRAIASQFDVSIGTIEMLISSENGLVEHRKKCRYHSKRRKYKAEILRVVKSHPNWARQQIRQKHNAAFSWLFMHEKNWLYQNLPDASPPTRHVRVDWNKRDELLATQISDILSKAVEKPSLTKLELIIGHRWLLKNKDKLPKTMSIYNRF